MPGIAHPYKCETQQRSLQPTMYMRVRTAVQALPQMTGKVYATIAQYLGQLGEQPSGPPFVVYYNMDMQNLDVEIGFPVAKRLTGQGEIKTGELPSGTVATCLHVGPYSDIGSAYEALTHWVNEHGYTPTGVAYEVYLNDPAITRPEELRTQVMYPLKPR